MDTSIYTVLFYKISHFFSFFKRSGFSHCALEPQEYCKMQTLILRHNKLISTEGIEILVSLRQLDLGHNMLSSIDPEIVRLKSLQSLTALTLEGNPIALLDQYRSHLW